MTTPNDQTSEAELKAEISHRHSIAVHRFSNFSESNSKSPGEFSGQYYLAVTERILFMLTIDVDFTSKAKVGYLAN